MRMSGLWTTGLGIIMTLRWRGTLMFDAVCFVYTCRRLIDLSNDCRYKLDAQIPTNGLIFASLHRKPPEHGGGTEEI